MPRDHRHRLSLPCAADDALPPLLFLDDPRCADPTVSGAKAAWLARGIEAGLSILPGLVVSAPVSSAHLAIGVDALARRGSGGARLEVSQTALAEPLVSELTRLSGELGDPLVVRSSSLLEGGAEWSGAFTSYLEIHPEEVPRAVTGCWASAFGVSTLERHAAAAIEPGSASMAVLIQPALHPEFGGTARLEGGDVVLVAVVGSPAPLVQGWEPGAQARIRADGSPVSGAALDIMSEELVEAVANALREAHASVGATTCEWAVQDGVVVLLQLMRPVDTRKRSTVSNAPELMTATAVDLSRLARRYPGAWGEALILPWAVGDATRFLDPVPPTTVDPAEALALATEHSATLTAEVWSLAKPAAAAAAQEALWGARGSQPGRHLDLLAGLRPPDPDRARLVLALTATVRQALVDLGAVNWPESAWHFDPAQIPQLLSAPSSVPKRIRIGFDRWEPFGAAVTVSVGRRAPGTSAAQGIACGRLCHIPDPTRADHFRPRDVIVAPHPVPHLAALLWDATAVVTTGGSPAAHLFESARALGMPAVCGVQLEEALGGPLGQASGAFALAVDGGNGTVTATDW